jgi:hypothetical protein
MSEKKDEDKQRIHLSNPHIDGFAKWSTPNTSTVANDPSNQINRAKGEPNKNPATPGDIPPSKSTSNGITTITDGKTKVKTSVEKNTDISRGARQAYFNQHGVWPPCLNSDCSKYLVAGGHPNCACYQNSPEYGLAHGGCVGNHKEDCEYFASGGEVEFNKLHLNNPQAALDLVGAQKGLLHLITKTGQNGKSQDPHKHLEEYVDNARRGHKTLDSHVSKLLGPEKLDVDSNSGDVTALRSHLDDLQANPEKALDVGGDLGSTLPMHGAALGSKLANSLNYFQSLKPQASQNSPLDPIIPPSKASENAYHRQLEIAENPMLVLHHSKFGTLQPQDLKTLHTIYPSLGQSMTQKSGEALIDAKQKNTSIPYRQKQGLSQLLGQPLDSTQTVGAMQAIIKANTPSQVPQSQGQSKKASGTELKQIDKVNEDFATPTQKRLMGKS